MRWARPCKSSAFARSSRNTKAPSFLTDGNRESFEGQGQALYRKLQSLGVPADVLFFPAEDGDLPHEYQFRYDKYGRQADECFSRTLRFLDIYMK